MIEALDAGDITKIGVGVIIAIVVIGFIIGMIISAIVGRLIVAVIVIVLGIFVWQQRTSVENKIDQYRDNACNFHASFFGIGLSAPDSLKQMCQAHPNRRHRRQG